MDCNYVLQNTAAVVVQKNVGKRTQSPLMFPEDAVLFFAVGLMMARFGFLCFPPVAPYS